MLKENIIKIGDYFVNTYLFELKKENIIHQDYSFYNPLWLQTDFTYVNKNHGFWKIWSYYPLRIHVEFIKPSGYLLWYTTYVNIPRHYYKGRHCIKHIKLNDL